MNSQYCPMLSHYEHAEGGELEQGMRDRDTDMIKVNIDKTETETERRKYINKKKI